MKGILREIGITVGLAIVVFFAINTTILSTVVDGTSMEPGLHNMDRILVSRVSYQWLNFEYGGPQRGDVIVFWSPVEPGKRYVKRVIGLPGDTVEIKNGTVYVDNKPITEPYIKDAPRNPMSKITVPPDNYFVLGDNRSDSFDSRYGYYASRSEIEGKAWLAIWPPGQWGGVNNTSLDQQISGPGK